MIVCTFAGHREPVDRMDEFRIPKALSAAVEELLERDREFCFYFSGLGWFDLLSAHIVRRVKKGAPKKRIRLVLIQPYARKSRSASPYDEIFVPEELQRLNPIAAIPERNRWLVEHSDHLIAYVRRSGGAADLVRYAQSLKLEVHML